MIGRREFLAAGGWLFVAPWAAHAQAPGKIYRFGSLTDITLSSTPLAAFTPRLGELGYIEGMNAVFDVRTAAGHVDRLPALAAEIIRLKPDLLFSAGGFEVARALKGATTTLPVLFSAVERDPVATGIVASLVRPTGNFTGVALFATELAAKRLELLREAVPRSTRVAVIWQRIRGDAQLKAVREAAPSLKLQVISIEVREIPGDLEGASLTAAQQRADALLILGSPAFLPERERLAELAIKHRLPSSFQRPAYAEAGGLMSFGADLDDMWRRLAVYADRVLKGAQPSDLPIEQPTKFDLVINLKTAKALGLTLPPALLGRADRVIE